MHAEATARAGHQYGIAWCYTSDGTDGVEHGADRAGCDRSRIQRHVIGDMRYVVGFDRDELRESAIQSRIAKEDLFRA
jgi:hypothetical protein